ncbi:MULTISPECIES: hypothetical protein [Haloarcula]|uniref:hypothetical protein n=1 Tax=Haloarcula TaxID=2237 RepID=UPI0023E86479|nr:hypothetical protein [Halomicroarcula sp. SHR3]
MSVDEFEAAVEEAIGQEIWVDDSVGDDLGWFFVETELEFQGETFDAEVDFNLSEDDITVLYAEIPIDSEREAILEEETQPLDGELREYYPEENELGDLVPQLRDVHDDVFGGR